MIKCHPPIVLARVAKLWSEIASLYARHVFVRVEIPDLHDEHADAVVVYVAVVFGDDDPGDDEGVVGGVAQFARPPFGCVDAGGVQDEFLLFFIVRRRSFQGLHIRSMANFCLGIAAKNVTILNLRHPYLFLIVIAKRPHGIGKHRAVESQRELTLVQVEPLELILWIDVKVVVPSLRHLGPNIIDLLIPFKFPLGRGPLVVLRRRCQHAVIQNVLVQLVN